MNGEPAYVAFISPAQINFLIPADLPRGPVQIQVRNNGLSSTAAMVTLQPAAPAFFVFGGTKYAAATHSDGVSLTGPPGLITGVATTPLKPGETVVLYVNGLGATTPPIPNGQLISSPLPLTVSPTVTIGGSPAQVAFAGLTAAGLYQINAIVPVVPTGDAAMVDAAVIAQVQGISSPTNTFLSVSAMAAIPNTAVDISNFLFLPDPIMVQRGTSVVWTNKDNPQHTVTADNNGFKSNNLNKGDTFSQTLNTPGTYTYHCSIHPFMKGTIVVQ